MRESGRFNINHDTQTTDTVSQLRYPGGFINLEMDEANAYADSVSDARAVVDSTPNLALLE
ncbi:MAG: hypothetical protein R2764_07750 [Bacteroidales bacterium]